MNIKINNIYIIIGLGNYPEKYLDTYHNVGFLFLDWLDNKYGSGWDLNKKIPANISSFTLPNLNNEFLIVKPQCYMNESGTIIKKLLKYTNFGTNHMIVVHDDSDIHIGNCKVSYKKGGAGHKGVESIIETLKTKDFYRLRIGVRSNNSFKNTSESNYHNPMDSIKKIFYPKRKKAGDFVLKKISKNNLKILNNYFPAMLEKLQQKIKKY